MTETLLAKLSSRVESASTAEEKGLALARYAIALAQAGQIVGALEILKQLRVGDHYSDLPRISIIIILLDGVILYYSSRSERSLDRVRRANLLAKSLQIKDLETETAVWLVHFAFNFDDYDLLEYGLRLGFEGFSLLPDELCGRICLSVADANQYLGHRDVSSAWYGMSRLFAQRAHDHAMMAAIEYNRLGMGLSRLRVESCFVKSEASDERRHWLAEMASIERLHFGLGANALSELLLLCESRVRELEADFFGASQVLVRIRDGLAAHKCGISTQLLELEILWCQVLSDTAGNDFALSVPTLDEIDNLSHDEQFVALHFLRDIMQRIGVGFDDERFAKMQQRAAIHCNESIAAIQRIIEISLPDIQVVRNEFSRRI